MQNFNNNISIAYLPHIKRAAEMHVSELMFVIAFLLLLLEDPIARFFPYANFLDEIFALVGLFAYLLSSNKIKLNILVPVFLYIMSAFVGWIFNSQQPLIAVVNDAFLNLKFFFALLFGASIVNILSPLSIKIIAKIAKIFTLFLTVIIVYNFFFHVFPGQEYRFGIQIPKLFFSHSEYLAGFQVLLLAVGLLGGVEKKSIWENTWILIAVLNILSTLRYKAIIASVFIVILLYIIIVRKKIFAKWNFIVLAIVAVLIAWSQIVEYFFDTVTARGALTSTSITIAKDYFPFGIGFASFGSYMSKVFYSPFYYQYGLSSIYGLMNIDGANSFISDTFWPMVIAQSGVVGTVCFIWALGSLYKKINSIYYENIYLYSVSLYLFGYMIIQSTGSAAFVGPIAVPVGIIIGICIGMAKNKNIFQLINRANE